MAYDEKLAERIRDALSGTRGLTETKMFGGIGFMVGGNMCCGVMKDELLLRVDPDAQEALLAKNPVRPMEMMKGRPAKGFVLVAATAVRTDAQLKTWVGRGLEYASSLAPKAAKKAPAKKRRS